MFPIISIKNVSKSYKKEHKVLDNISLEILPGEIFGFLGQNGAGKTTLIRIITGIIALDEGSITLNGVDLYKEAIKAKLQFSLMPDSPEIYSKVRGIDWLHFIGSVYNLSDAIINQRIEEFASKFEITDALYQQVGTYSFGMKHKLSLIAGLLHDPSILIFDEPLQGLDPNAAYWLKGVMKDHVKKGGTVFFSTHLLDVAEKICDRFAILKNSKIITVGNMQDIASKEINLESYFLELTKNEKK